MLTAALNYDMTVLFGAVWCGVLVKPLQLINHFYEQSKKHGNSLDAISLRPKWHQTIANHNHREINFVFN